jgi:hypothetical protein
MPHPATRAHRRAERARAVAHAKPIVGRLLGYADPLRVLRWADNLRKCSCPMCNSGDPHDSRQMRRAADAATCPWEK